MKFAAIAVLITLLGLTGLMIMGKGGVAQPNERIMSKKPDNAPYATLAGGCFWCLESEFRPLKGVLFTRVGYEGGHVENPGYQDVTSGKTGHAEAIEVYYDPEVTSYRALVDHFMRRAHDPTQIDRQGVDIGPQYRSAIFYHDATQKQIAQELIAQITAEKLYKNPIATQLSPKGTFWEAEDYHQQYYEKYEARTGAPHIRVLLKQKKKATNPGQDQ